MPCDLNICVNCGAMASYQHHPDCSRPKFWGEADPESPEAKRVPKPGSVEAGGPNTHPNANLPWRRR